MAVDDPDFTDVDRTAEKVDNHPVEDQVFKIECNQFRGRDITDPSARDFFLQVFHIQPVHVLVDDAVLCSGHFCNQERTGVGAERGDLVEPSRVFVDAIPECAMLLIIMFKQYNFINNKTILICPSERAG